MQVNPLLTNSMHVRPVEHNPGGIMEKTLQRLGQIDIIPPPGPSRFVSPQTVMYHLDGEPPSGPLASWQNHLWTIVMNSSWESSADCRSPSTRGLRVVQRACRRDNRKRRSRPGQALRAHGKLMCSCQGSTLSLLQEGTSRAGSYHKGSLSAAGKQRRWDMVKAHSSVGIVLYHAEEDALLVVRQFRPAVSS